MAKIFYTLLFILMLGLAFTFPHAASADAADADSIDAALDAKEKQVEDQVKPIDEEAVKLKAESERIKNRLTELNKSKAQILKTADVGISAQDMHHPMTLKHGDCKITEGEKEDEYIIEKDDVKIRFFIASERTEQKPTVKRMTEDNIDFKVYTQPEWTMIKDGRSLKFSAEIKTTTMTSKEKSDEIVTYSNFRGETIDERTLGFMLSALPPLTRIICVDATPFK